MTSEFVLSTISILVLLAIMWATLHKMSPSLSAALSAWAARQNVEAQRMKIWAEGFEQGREFQAMQEEARNPNN